MKNFRTVTIAVLAVITVLFAANIYFLCALYRSVKEQYIAMARECLVQADMMETVYRLKNDPTASPQDYQFALDLNLNDSEEGSVSVAKVDSMLNERVINIFQAVNTTMAYRLRSAAAGFGGPTDFAVLDSLFMIELNRVGLYPSRVAVLPSDSAAPAFTSGMWHIGYTILPGEPVIYNAYITPPLSSILGRTVGVVVTIGLIIAALAFAFWYLIRTVMTMRSIEEMKDDFTNNMTHELKTPIAIAYSVNDTLLNCGSHNNPEKRVRYLRMALEQLTRLSELVEQILAMSMERRKTLVLDREKIVLRPFIEEIAETQRLRAPKPTVIHVDVVPPSLEISADPTHLGNVINNLVDNAIKYSLGSVEISIRADRGAISVADNGIGIPAKSLPLIFNKFYRVPTGDRQDVRGYGIGLYYVRGIVEKMGWSISAASTPGKGSAFTIKMDDKDEK